MEQINRIRDQLGITVVDFVKRIGVSRDTYYKWLRCERKPKFEHIAKMCDVLELDVLEVVKEIYK